MVKKCIIWRLILKWLSKTWKLFWKPRYKHTKACFIKKTSVVTFKYISLVFLQQHNVFTTMVKNLSNWKRRWKIIKLDKTKLSTCNSKSSSQLLEEGTIKRPLLDIFIHHWPVYLISSHPDFDVMRQHVLRDTRLLQQLESVRMPPNKVVLFCD